MKYKKEEAPIIPPREVVLGEPDAAVSVVMFGDYESAECARANEAILRLYTEFPGKINFVYRHFPMTMFHQKAHKAAEAAIGAAQEGLFWEMHKYLFEHHHNLGVISLKSHAREVGVKDKKFLDKLINSTWGWFVQDDIRDGMDQGVKEIPAIFINGARFDQNPTYNNLKQQINTLIGDVGKVVKLKSTKRA
jgi:protein-disulfide isomerase